MSTSAAVRSRLNAFLRTRPVGVLGSVPTNSMSRGSVKSESRAGHHSRRSRAVTPPREPSPRSVTPNAFASSSASGEGTGTTGASTSVGCAKRILGFDRGVDFTAAADDAVGAADEGGAGRGNGATESVDIAPRPDRPSNSTKCAEGRRYLSLDVLPPSLSHTIPSGLTLSALSQRRNTDRSSQRITFRTRETRSIDVIGMYIRVVPLVTRMSPGSFPNQERAPVQASSPHPSRSSPPPTSHGPQSLVTDPRPPCSWPPETVLVAWASVLNPRRRTRSEGSAPAVQRRSPATPRLSDANPRGCAAGRKRRPPESGILFPRLICSGPVQRPRRPSSGTAPTVASLRILTPRLPTPFRRCNPSPQGAGSGLEERRCPDSDVDGGCGDENSG